MTPMDGVHSTGLTTLSFDGFDRDQLQSLVYDLYAKHNVIVKFQYLDTMYDETSSADPDRVGMRVSVAYFNTKEEIASLLTALAGELAAMPARATASATATVSTATVSSQ